MPSDEAEFEDLGHPEKGTGQHQALPSKPLGQWTVKDLKEARELLYIPGAPTPIDAATEAARRRWLRLLIQPGLAVVIAAYCRGERLDLEEHVGELVEQVYPCPEKADDPHNVHALSRWFLRNYAYGAALRMHWKLLGASNRCCPWYVLVSEILLVRVIVSVLIGMLAVCGTSPWPLVTALHGHDAPLWWAAGLCLGFALVYRILDVAKRTQSGLGTVVFRAAGLTMWGWFWGWLVVRLFAWLFAASEDPCTAAYVLENCQVLLPSAGVAVGVVLQELWDEKPISEPV